VDRARETAGELPADVLQLAKDYMLDHIAVSLYGMKQPWTEFVAQQVHHERGVAEASVYGQSTKVPMRAARAGQPQRQRAFELDDWHAASLSHVSACVIPAVLAVAEHHHLGTARARRDRRGLRGHGARRTDDDSGAHHPRISPERTHGPIGAAAGLPISFNSRRSRRHGRWASRRRAPEG
jgi:hypothetical protein